MWYRAWQASIITRLANKCFTGETQRSYHAPQQESTSEFIMIETHAIMILVLTVLKEINIQNMNVELVAQMFKNYQSNVLFHLEGKSFLYLDRAIAN